jgi:formyl-CoA transferase
MSGLMSVTGEPGRGPMRVGIAICDIITGLYAALGILTALVERQQSGEGQWVQSSLMESTLFTMDLHAARYLVEGHVPKQVGNEHPSGVPTNAYKTKDGYVNVAPIPSMWGRLCKALGREDLTEHPDFATREVRRKRRAEVNALIQGITEQMDTATLTAKLQAAEVPCGPIYTLDQAFADPQVQHLRLAQSVTAHDGKEIKLPRQPFSLSRTPSTIAVRTPEFAEHTDEILREFGYGAEEITALRKQGAIE